MNQVIKSLFLLIIACTTGQLLSKYYYFHSFNLFTFTVGYLSLFEVGLIFLFIFLGHKILTFYFQPTAFFNQIKLRVHVLSLILAFIAGIHFIGGEFQNTLVLKPFSGPLMDMATFYDAFGHLLIFALVLTLFYLLNQAEMNSQKKKVSLKTREFLGLLLASFIFSLGITLTMIKSAFVILCFITLFFFCLIYGGRFLFNKKINFKKYPLNLFLLSFLSLTLILILIWLILPYQLKKPIIQNYISLGEEIEFRTSFQENSFWQAITQTW